MRSYKVDRGEVRPYKNFTMADSKQGKSPMEDHFNGSSQSRVVLAKPRLGGVGSFRYASSSNKSNLFNNSVLRPPQLKPGNNPFLKVTENSETVSDKEDKEKDTESTSEDRLKESNEEPEAPKFIPLRSTTTPRTANLVAPVDSAASSSSGFVFGQNLSERVVINENLNNGESSTVDHSATNGASELLFTSAAASVKDSEKEEAGPSEASSSEAGSGLAAAAAEYERSHARPPPPAASYSVTGEEDEINVLQISCRLFAWEAGSWRERGRGVLRLNDAGAGSAGTTGAARLVARVAGSLRVVLNTKLWPGMVAERAGTKSLRITAADAQQQVKLFLIMGAPSDISQLYRALTARITVNKRANASAQSAPSQSQEAAERLEAAADDADYEDKANDDLYGRDQPSYDTPDQDKPSNTERLHEKTEESSVDDEEKKSLKRKEPAEDETSPKRQCPKILIE